MRVDTLAFWPSYLGSEQAIKHLIKASANPSLENLGGEIAWQHILH
jgi:hypothetical protein